MAGSKSLLMMALLCLICGVSKVSGGLLAPAAAEEIGKEITPKIVKSVHKFLGSKAADESAKKAAEGASRDAQKFTIEQTGERSRKSENENSDRSEEVPNARQLSDAEIAFRAEQYETELRASIETDADELADEEDLEERCRKALKGALKESACFILQTYVKAGRLPNDAELNQFAEKTLGNALQGCVIRRAASGGGKTASDRAFKFAQALAKFIKETKGLPFRKTLEMAVLNGFCNG